MTRQCDGCIFTHTDSALKHGSSREEIVEALGVIAVNGAALVHSARAMDMRKAKKPYSRLDTFYYHGFEARTVSTGNEIPDKRPHSERYFSWTAGSAAAE